MAPYIQRVSRDRQSQCPDRKQVAGDLLRMCPRTQKQLRWQSLRLTAKQRPDEESTTFAATGAERVTKSSVLTAELLFQRQSTVVFAM